MAERDGAVHAARALDLEELRFGMLVELLPVEDALQGRPVGRELARVLQETGRLTQS